MGVKEFKDSITKLQIETGGTDEELSRYIPSILKDRGEKYIEKLQKKYPHSLVQKAQEYYEGLSPMEQMEFAEHFEEVLPAAIEANSEAFTADEVRALFTKDGQRKTLTPGVFDTPVRDYDRTKWNYGEGELVEEPKTPPPPSVEATISYDQARSMDLAKLRAMLPETVESEE